MTGILINYGVGNDMGSFTVNVDDALKPLVFYIGWPIHINNMLVNCPHPPIDYFKPTVETCPDWPTDIIIGHTTVRVTFWKSEFQGRPVLISDQIDSNIQEIIHEKIIDDDGIFTKRDESSLRTNG